MLDRRLLAARACIPAVKRQGLIGEIYGYVLQALGAGPLRIGAAEWTGPYDIPVLCSSGAVRITGRPPDGANVTPRRTTRTV